MRIALLALTALCLAATVAEAAPKRSRYADDIVVTRRSYFDAGVLVKPGSLGATNYVWSSQNATPPYQNINSTFGGETLPSRWYLPNCCDVPLSRFAND